MTALGAGMGNSTMGDNPGRAGYRQATPTVQRMLVGRRLRALREAGGISREEAGRAIGASPSRIGEGERGRTGFDDRDVAGLLTLYGVTDEAERATLLALAGQAAGRAWWQAYDDVVPAWFEPYLGLEQGASVIRCFEARLVPGLLQTEDYARAIIRRECPDAPQLEIDRRVGLRMRRQRMLRGPEAAKFWGLIDEAALRRPPCGPSVMRAQLQHLIWMTELPHINVQVLPVHATGSGVRATAGGPVTLLRFSEADLPDAVYLDQLTGAIYPDEPHDVRHYTEMLDRLAVGAVPPEATVDLLRRILRET